MSTSAIQRLRASFLPFCLPAVGEEEISEAGASLRSGCLASGEKVRRFEQDFAEYVGAEHAVAVNSGTMALHLSLMALGVGQGDEVLLPSLGSCAAASVVVHLGATPVLVDVDAAMLVDLDAAERAITARSKMILPSHYGGQSCDLDGVAHLARRYGLFVVEDAAQAAGAEYGGVRIGTHGDGAAFSFCDTAPMTTGNGGMVTTNDVDFAARVRRLSQQGMSTDLRGRDPETQFRTRVAMDAGYEGQMTEVAAGVGIHQLRRLSGFVERRRQIARRYQQALGGTPELDLPVELAGRGHIFQAYSVLLDLKRMTIGRDQFVKELIAARIGATVPDLPVHQQPFYATAFHYRQGAFPTTDQLYQRMVSLPIYPSMTNADVEDVVDAIRTTVLGHRR